MDELSVLSISLSIASLGIFFLFFASNDEYQEVTHWLIKYVDEVGKNSSNEEVEKYKKLFKLGIEFEIGFWDSAWNS